MKITQFILTLGFGGAEAVVRDYAIALKELGHEVEVIVLFHLLNNDNEIKLIEKGIKIRSIYSEIFLINSNSFFFRVLRKPFRTIKVRNWIKKYIEEENIDVFHCHLEVLRYLIPGLFSKNKTKLFFTCHNESSYYFGNSHSKEVKSAKKLFAKDNLRMFALHERMKEELNNIFNVKNTEVMYNPIQLYKFINKKGNTDKLKNELKISSSDLIIGHVGRFVEQKNHDFLIDVFNEILMKEKNTKLLLVGDGPLKKNIQNKCISLGIESSVIFTGLRKDIPELMSCMDKFVFPSKFEGFPVVLIEAQSIIPEVFVSDRISNDIAVTQNISFISLKEIKNFGQKKLFQIKYLLFLLTTELKILI